MPDLVEHMYCSQQINIPATFPYIMKQYAKAAIRTQPFDLLQWTATYFRAMANEEVPPVKPRFEHVPLDSPPGLTPGYLRVLLKQLGHKSRVVGVAQLFDKWCGVCLNEDSLHELLQIGDFGEEIDWLHFVAIATGHLTKSLGETMILLCELLTREPEGGSAMIPCSTFNELYNYLAKLDCGPLEVSEMSLASPDTELEKQTSDISAHTPSATTLPQIPSVESVGEEPPLPPLVYYKPSRPQSEEDVASRKEYLEEDNTSRIMGTDPFVYNMDDDVLPQMDEETQTEAVTSNESVRPHVYVPGIGPELSDEQIEAVVKYMEWWAERQEGMAMPRNIRHFLCPPLDQLPLIAPCSDNYHYPNTNIYP